LANLMAENGYGGYSADQIDDFLNPYKYPRPEPEVAPEPEKAPKPEKAPEPASDSTPQAVVETPQA